MKSFSSSVINKSGKKFAPKAPIRRAPPAASTTPAPPRRPSIASQAQTIQNAQSAIDKASAEPAPSVPVIDSSVAPAADVPLADAESSVAQEPDSVPPKSAAAIPIPRPKRKASVSISVAGVRASEPITTVQPVPPEPETLGSTHKPTGPVVNEVDKQGEVLPSVEEPQGLSTRDEIALPEVVPQPHTRTESATETRPSKRPKVNKRLSTVSASSDHTPHVITPPSTQTQTPAVEEATGIAEAPLPPTTADQSRRASKSRSRRPSRIINSEDAGDKSKKKPQRSRKKREPTPEGADLIEIAPAVIKMSELCKDLRTGKMSKRETELRNLEIAEQERKRTQQDGESHAQTPIKQNTDVTSPTAEADILTDKKPQAGPVMRIVNGEIVLDAASLQVDRHADAARNVGDLEDVVESSLTRKINQATYGKRSKTESWDEEMTDLFYRGLRMFGTDFMMISKLFPGRSRRQIKLKFNNEERRAPERIKDTLLGPRESIDIMTYSEMTNTVYDDPKEVEQELLEEKKRIEEQHAKEKQAQEDLLRNPNGAIDGTAAPGTDNANSVPIKSKRNNRKQALKNMGGGTEEVVGTIDDFP
ncbi:transcription factor TFIIIB subunit BDP1 [Aspergillus clavatus NRRL 1]|uniref:Transcription factor TFIIIB component, putative n=1 Tax=Aspergillus clavatus (strain ATCC 1007 / CBS 513.65 / DSM 816 / NCTC 3887 / NRRL 1 / QM 1276 / 107) TaxID=344612 RepID=A1CM88_ASPCL|nr:transcription factor TFIIIB component, putative [Aspergillus clavatus NRRL 1]EAW08675.1 transcription factor TFIIIB component, putative [Aspergillus clavatus NRRL 1]